MLLTTNIIRIVLTFSPSTLHVHFHCTQLTSDSGFLIRLSRPKEKDREKEMRDKERESSREGHSISYSHSALTVSSEAVSLFRFLLKTEEWRSVVEEELMRALQRITCRVTEHKVGTIES